MKLLEKVTITALVIAVVVLFGFQFSKQSNVSQSPLGANPGPDFFNYYFAFNENEYYPMRQPMRTATTTLCSFKSPNATTTIEVASFQITKGTSTQATIDIATSTSAYATSSLTSLVSKTIASSAQGYGYFHPLGGSVDDARVSPNTPIVVQTAAAGLGGYTDLGNCQIVFKKL